MQGATSDEDGMDDADDMTDEDGMDDADDMTDEDGMDDADDMPLEYKAPLSIYQYESA